LIEWIFRSLTIEANYATVEVTKRVISITYCNPIAGTVAAKNTPADSPVFNFIKLLDAIISMLELKSLDR
jgi:hypothetical protein